MGNMALRQLLYLELDNASPELLRQLYEYVQFLKRAEKNTVRRDEKENPIQPFIGCMKGKEGDEFAAAIENEFNQLEGEW